MLAILILPNLVAIVFFHKKYDDSPCPTTIIIMIMIIAFITIMAPGAGDFGAEGSGLRHSVWVGALGLTPLTIPLRSVWSLTAGPRSQCESKQQAKISG